MGTLQKKQYYLVFNNKINNNQKTKTRKMKKIFLLPFAMVAISMASCKKTRICTCNGTATDVQTVTNPAGSTTSSSSSPISYTDILSKTTKAAAKGNGECLSRVETYTETSQNGNVVTKDDYTHDITCTIK